MKILTFQLSMLFFLKYLFLLYLTMFEILQLFFAFISSSILLSLLDKGIQQYISNINKIIGNINNKKNRLQLISPYILITLLSYLFIRGLGISPHNWNLCMGVQIQCLLETAIIKFRHKKSIYKYALLINNSWFYKEKKCFFSSSIKKFFFF